MKKKKVKYLKRIGYGVLADTFIGDKKLNEEIGSGERGQKYIFWDQYEAQEFVNHPMRDWNPKHMKWKVVPVTIIYHI